jgi:SpoVK/Ycf46/Vps4 family AAA+-type ATPase
MSRRRVRNNALAFDKSDFIDTTLVEKASLWILRLILNLGGHRELVDKDGDLSYENIIYFLELDKYAALDSEEYTRREVIESLEAKLIKLEEQASFSSHKVLSKNIAQISKLMNLNKTEEIILEFITVMKQYELLESAVNLLGHELNTSQTKRALSVILDIPLSEIKKAFISESKFSKSSLVSIDKGNTFSLDRKIDSISDTFLDNLLNLDEDISVMIKESVKICSYSSLKCKDYKHISQDLEILLPYLKKAIKKRKTGVNILFYGLPGTGKTELVKVLSKKLKCELFEVSYIDEDEEPIDGKKRLTAYKSAQALLANKKTLLMYDEAEDIFESSVSFFAPKRQKDKAWINRVLESNTIPTIWITNNIHSIDAALVRRFDMSIELPIPPKSKREEIIREFSQNLLQEKSILRLAKNENIAPALISSTAKVVSSSGVSNSDKAFMHVLSSTLKAQGHKPLDKESEGEGISSLYDTSFINSSVDLEELAEGIQKSKNARVCLYGPAGTGKSAFGKYVSEKLDKPLILKKASDLMSKWVGGTEANIAMAFKEAKEEDAVLVFDEVDSFLADRAEASNSWEITQVNEMLVQMENFNGIFIATTNLMDSLDKASLRRFDLKLKFDFLKAEQSWSMFLAYAKELKLKTPSSSLRKTVESLKYLTPGDFAAVTRQNRFRPITNVKDFMQRVEDEVAVKSLESDHVMGFLAS